MLSGYWQVELDQESIPMTVFYYTGLHLWKVMPSGLSGALGNSLKLMKWKIALGSMT